MFHVESVSSRRSGKRKNRQTVDKVRIAPQRRSLVYKISQTEGLSAHCLLLVPTRAPQPIQALSILQAVAANAGRKGDALSSLALAISIK